jgi:hypothetical protein
LADLADLAVSERARHALTVESSLWDVKEHVEPNTPSPLADELV